MNYPGVTCILPTSNRPPERLHLLEESVESFLRQDYPGSKELVLLNDTPHQILHCEREGIRVVNHPSRYPTLGEKHNVMVELATHDLVLPWDDDDISLPFRITQAVERIGHTPYWNPGRHWLLDFDFLHYKPDAACCGHAAAIFRKEAWRRVEGYPALSCGYDQVIDHALKGLGGTLSPVGRDPEEWAYIYCWAGRSDCHVSGYNQPEEAYREIIGKKPVQQRTFEITPRWHRDYEAMVRARVAELRREGVGV